MYYVCEGEGKGKGEGLAYWHARLLCCFINCALQCESRVTVHKFSELWYDENIQK